jgi:hypothetical protein
MLVNKPIKQLPLEFSGRGEVKSYSYKQIKRSNLCYIYEVLAENGQTWYEVFKAKINPLYGNISYPSSKQFGLSAWSARNLEKALMRFEKITKEAGYNLTDDQSKEYRATITRVKEAG